MGPLTMAPCPMDEPQATAFWKCSPGTSWGRSACDAGP